MARGLIFAARHPRPAMSSRVCYGSTDVPLAEPPERGAAALIAALGLAEHEYVGRVITAPLQRARLVAQAAARELGARLHTDDRLTEMDFGAWEGRPWTAIPRREIDAWAADPLHHRPGGGESVAEVLARVRRAWTTLASSEDITLVVTHAGPIRCLLHVARGVPVLEAIRADVAYGAVVRFE